ncbi:hypothetical protein A1OE_791 [Candidatus Endolissoclinum faulkneri L2]|uniref:Uncharacterized protein n=1 Tax=Candidatus Endolissoclinum faulkneri L2 TaxID=1193729 RepID=K7ZCX7_9PROT|nr:hypothetical protein A1OE_791 [Candidatus Endolissoclinum faulkneri L2]
MVNSSTTEIKYLYIKKAQLYIHYLMNVNFVHRSLLASNKII